MTMPRITPREVQVIDLLLRGLKTPQIAKELGLTLSTVATYFKRIFAKFGVHSQVELAALVRRERYKDLATSARGYSEIYETGIATGQVLVERAFLVRVADALEAP